jgi:hypothetical protein
MRGRAVAEDRSDADRLLNDQCHIPCLSFVL